MEVIPLTTKAGTEQPPRDVLPLHPGSRKKATKPRAIRPPLERAGGVAPRRRW
jgi:hypothetical protein